MAIPQQRERSSENDGEYKAPLAVFECLIERVTFHNAETGYGVVKVTAMETKAKAKGDVITVLGNFPNPTVGESLRCHGTWIKHPQYGSQFKMERYETLRPATAAAIEKYLGSGMVKGIGPKMAERMVKKFGEKTLDIIETSPDKLLGVSGLGQKRIDLIRAAWEEQKEVRAIMLFLQGHGVTPTYATKIYRTYKERSIEVVERNPYQLATDIWGVGFKSADKIAQNIGIAVDAPERLEAGLVYVLNQEMESGGHVFLPEDTLIEKAVEILGAEQAPVERALESLLERQMLVNETVEMLGVRDTAIYTPSMFTTERAVAERINTLLNSPWRSRPASNEIDKIVNGLSGYDTLSNEQQQAVRRALSEPLMVLTGGPGTGKTTTTKTIVAAFEKLEKRLQIASPTGRAAKRAAEVTGKEAKTIHRLLSFDPEKKGFKHGPGEPLELDVLVVDESSMLDLNLTHHLLRAVPDGAQVIFVGDVDQLPSVGPGNVLADLIDSGRVPVARLSQVFRQAASSHIITSAHAMNKGKMPTLSPPSAATRGESDCVFVEVEESADIPDKIAAVVSKSLPKLGFKPDDITVLAPMQRGTVGARNLNEVLQAVMNPPSPSKAEYQRGPVTFRVGDRVMQRVNNYDKNVFNGDVGHILSIDKEGSLVGVMYPEGPVEYDFVDMDQLNHALSISIHKCIAGHERVWTVEQGMVPIRELEPGTTVYTGLPNVTGQITGRFDSGTRPVFRVRTEAGFEIDVSAEHPLLTVSQKGDGVEWETCDAIQVGRYLCLHREPVAGGSLALPAAQQRVGTRATLPALPETMDENLAYLLGALVGNGSYRDRKDGTVDFTNQDAEVLTRVRATLESYGLRVCTYENKTRNRTRLYVVSRVFRHWLHELGLDYSPGPDKTVPPVLFHATAACRAAFLRGLWDTDGSASRGTVRAVRLTTASVSLARSVQQLLLSLGIVSRRTQTTERAWSVAVSGTSLLLFSERVGFTIAAKTQRLNDLLALAGDIGKTNDDVLPQGAFLVEQIEAVLRHTFPARGRGGRSSYRIENKRIAVILQLIRDGKLRLSYQHLRQIVTFFQQKELPLPSDVYNAVERRYFYDRVKSIAPLPETDLWDIEVAGDHSFVAGGGFVCHNSQGSEYPAAIIAIHTQHYMMLQRNLIYTALTRAKKLAVFVGSQRAIQMAVRNQNTVPRNTRLAQRLQNLVDSLGTVGRNRGRNGEHVELPTPPMPGRLL